MKAREAVYTVNGMVRISPNELPNLTFDLAVLAGQDESANEASFIGTVLKNGKVIALTTITLPGGPNTVNICSEKAPQHFMDDIMALKFMVSLPKKFLNCQKMTAGRTTVVFEGEMCKVADKTGTKMYDVTISFTPPLSKTKIEIIFTPPPIIRPITS